MELEKLEHDKYHKNNEHKWGMWAFAKKYPHFAFTAGIIAAGAFGVTLDKIIHWIRLI